MYTSAPCLCTFVKPVIFFAPFFQCDLVLTPMCIVVPACYHLILRIILVVAVEKLFTLIL